MTNHDERQGFLGQRSAEIFASTTVGIVGLGGGGSHIVQQFAHIGFKKYVVVDPDCVENSNLNRLVGATQQDILDSNDKVGVARRQIHGIQPDAEITEVRALWEEASDTLLRCDVIVGAIDSVTAKHGLEQFCRRFHIPYFDIGMDVHKLPDDDYLIAGQVVRSISGGPCLKCLGIVTDKALETEAANYGAAGGLPQVVWPNGVLGSTVVGMVVHMLTPWTKDGHQHACIEFDANRNTMVPSPKLRALANAHCSHYLPNEVGDPLIDVRALRGGKVPAAECPDALGLFSRIISTLKSWLSL